MKTIIHATDYSENALAALKYSYSLCKKLNANLLVIHVFDYPTIMTAEVKEPYYHLEKDTFKLHTSKLKELCEEHLGDDLDKMNVSVEAIEDKSIVNGITSKATEISAFMIVTGMKGKSMLKEVILGNTTKHLIDKSPCPILAIPEDVSHSEIQTIVYATDFDQKDIKDIYILIEIAQPFNADIKVLHISPLKEFDRKKLISDFEKKAKENISYSNITFDFIPSDDTFEELRLYLGEENADIVAMLERKNNGLIKSIFHRDLVKKMESYGKIPLLSFNKNI